MLRCPWFHVFWKRARLAYPSPEPGRGLEPTEKAQNLKEHPFTQNSPVEMLLSSNHQSILPRTLEKCYFFSFLTLMLFLHNKTESVFLNRPFPREASNYPSIFGFGQIVITHKIPAADTVSICICVLHFWNDAETSINSPTLLQEN